MAKSHKSAKSKCDLCGFQSTDTDVVAHMKEFHLVHNIISQLIKEKRKKSVIGCDKCGVTADTKQKLKKHKESQHPVSEDSSSSSERSPPRKKPAKTVEVKVDEAEVNITDLMDFETVDVKIDPPDLLAKDEVIKNQANIIEKQAEAIKILEENVQKLVNGKNEENHTPSVKVSYKKRLYQIILLQ